MSNSGMSVCLNEERFRCNTRSGDPVKVTSRSCMGNGWAQVRITVQLYQKLWQAPAITREGKIRMNWMDAGIQKISSPLMEYAP